MAAVTRAHRGGPDTLLCSLRGSASWASGPGSSLHPRSLRTRRAPQGPAWRGAWIPASPALLHGFSASAPTHPLTTWEWINAVRGAVSQEPPCGEGLSSQPPRRPGERGWGILPGCLPAPRGHLQGQGPGLLRASASLHLLLWVPPRPCSAAPVKGPPPNWEGARPPRRAASEVPGGSRGELCCFRGSEPTLSQKNHPPHCGPGTPRRCQPQSGLLGGRTDGDGTSCGEARAHLLLNQCTLGNEEPLPGPAKPPGLQRGSEPVSPLRTYAGCQACAQGRDPQGESRTLAGAPHWSSEPEDGPVRMHQVPAAHAERGGI